MDGPITIQGLVERYGFDYSGYSRVNMDHQALRWQSHTLYLIGDDGNSFSSGIYRVYDVYLYSELENICKAIKFNL